jgi:hypothetical protein
MYLDRLVSGRMNGMSYTVTYLNERYYGSRSECDEGSSEERSVVFDDRQETAIEEAV